MFAADNADDNTRLQWHFAGKCDKIKKTEEKNGYHIYELFLKGDDTVQGRISVKIDGEVADVDIVETAPHNYSYIGIYEGVGAHLFAIACQVSLDAGCDGFVVFTSKSDLVEYYKEKLNAGIFRDIRMYIDENAAQILLNKYMRKYVLVCWGRVYT